MVTFGEWVRQHRTRRKLTRSELAERVGCSVAMLRKIEGEWSILHEHHSAPYVSSPEHETKGNER